MSNNDSLINQGYKILNFQTTIQNLKLLTIIEILNNIENSLTKLNIVNQSNILIRINCKSNNFLENNYPKTYKQYHLTNKINELILNISNNNKYNIVIKTNSTNDTITNKLLDDYLEDIEKNSNRREYDVRDIDNNMEYHMKLIKNIYRDFRNQEKPSKFIQSSIHNALNKFDGLQNEMKLLKPNEFICIANMITERINLNKYRFLKDNKRNKCICNNNKIEDINHYLLECPLYFIERYMLFSNLSKIDKFYNSNNKSITVENLLCPINRQTNINEKKNIENRIKILQEIYKFVKQTKRLIIY